MPTQRTPPPGGLDAAVYEELKRVARRHLRAHAGHETLSTTDLLHDAYLKFGGEAGGRWDSRAHFFGAASRAMRQVLVDHARARTALKRGGGLVPITLATSDPALAVRFEDLIELDEGLEQLRVMDERLTRVVELRFFGGLTDEEIATLLNVSVRTIGRDWRKARLLLADLIRQQ